MRDAPRKMEKTGASRLSGFMRILAIIAGLYALWIFLLSVAFETLVYPFSQDPWPGAGFEIVPVAAQDGVILPVGVRDAGPGSRTVLVFVGNVGSRIYFGDMYAPALAEGVSVIAAPYRGAEGVAGPRDEAVFRADALTVFDAIPELLGRAAPDVLVQGYSMGTGLAMEVAARRDTGGLILIAPFARLCEIMAQRTLVPACLLPWIDHWDSLSLTAMLDEPVLVVHGMADTLISFGQGEELADAVEEYGHLAELLSVPRATHFDILRFPEVSARIRSALRDGLAPGTFDAGTDR